MSQKKKIIAQIDSSLVNRIAAGAFVHRTSCHRCGNIRKNPIDCEACVMTFCICCERKIIAEYGKTSFIGGCVFCKKLCCCVHKEDPIYVCPRGLHCYKKCIIYRNRKSLGYTKPTPKPTPVPSTPLTTISLTVSTQTSGRQLVIADNGSRAYTPTTSLISSGLQESSASFLANSLGLSGSCHKKSAFSTYGTSSSVGGSGGTSPFENPWSLRDLCMDTSDLSCITTAGNTPYAAQFNSSLLSPAQYYMSPLASPLSPTDSVAIARATLGEDLYPCPMNMDLCEQQGGEDFFTKSYYANFGNANY